MVNILELKSDVFDPRTIMESGQVFRMFEAGPDIFVALSGANKVAFSRTDDEHVRFECEEEEWPFWQRYFDLDTDYAAWNFAIKKAAAAAGDKFILDSLEDARGMRILRQDLWETFISYMISQNNNIPKIKRTISILCDRYSDGEAFPGIGNLAMVPPMELSSGTMLGYRASYISEFSRRCTGGNFADLVQSLEGCNGEYVTTELAKIKGIGPKVASCIALYGLHCMDSYPIDTWMKHIIEEDYPGMNTREYLAYINSSYKGFQGYVQQLQFYHKRNLPKSEA